MTMFGKILVLCTLAFSLLCVGYALAVYGSQQVLSIPAPAAEGSKTAAAKPANLHGKEFNQNSERLAAARQELNVAKERWVANTKELTAVEEAYYSHPDFYRTELAALDDGPGNMKMIATQDGKLVLDDKIHGRVVMVDAKDELNEPVQSYKEYPPKIETQFIELGKLSKVLAGDPSSEDPKKKVGLIRWHENLTRLLYEELENQDPKGRGLRVELATEQFKNAQLIKELEYLEDFMNRLMVDQTGLDSRNKQMETRKKELQAKLNGK